VHLDVGFSQRSLALNPGLFYARFLANEVALEQIFLSKYHPLSHTNHYSIIAPHFSVTARKQVEFFVNFSGYSMVCG
jgi:hypothetical protein